jgi:NADH-quinone oxidoreductase subunit A
VAAKELGWTGWFRISFFIIMLMAGLVYIWAKGGLGWGPNQSQQ